MLTLIVGCSQLSGMSGIQHIYINNIIKYSIKIRKKKGRKKSFKNSEKNEE